MENNLPNTVAKLDLLLAGNNSPVQCGSFYLIKQSFYSRLLDTRFIIANATLRTSLAIYHPISDIYSRNNF